MNKYRTKLLIAMQLCSLLVSTLFVAASGSLEGSIVMLWLQALCSRRQLVQDRSTAQSREEARARMSLPV